MLEVLAATTILSFAVIAVAESVSVAQSQTYEALNDGRATALAEAFLEEVVSKPYADPAGGEISLGPDLDELTRSLFDNIDDYNGFTLDTFKEIPDVITDIAGNALPGTYQKYAINITTQYTTVTLFNAVSGINVTVTVTDKTGRTWTASRFVPESGG
jgi:MSHA pilin protein MshD